MADRVHTTRTWSSDRFPEAVASAVQAPGRAVLVTSADADAVGDGEHWTPTELLAAALSGCLFHAALDVAGRSKVELRGWRDQVVLTLDRTNGPARRVVAATVEVCVTVPAGTRPDRVARIVHKAHGLCTVAMSLAAPVALSVEVQVTDEDPAR
jgi:organic hydroperoxide reductase OsmC/OhrA